MDRVAVIGAGIAGLCTAKLLHSLGYDVQVFEKESELGGVWARSRRYPGLSTQNPRDTYAFSDFPMPSSYPEWPSGEQVQVYLSAYADQFGVKDRIAVDTTVVEAVPRPNGSGWTIRSHNTAEGEQTGDYDWLIVCNGIFSMPTLPAYAGAKSYRAAGGKLLHTSQFTQLEIATGKHVLVVGYGKSSCDVAIATNSVSNTTTLLARNLIWKIPKRLADKLNFKYLFMTRMGEALFPYIELKGFERFLHGRGRAIRNAMLASVQGVISRQLRLKEIGLEPEQPLENIARSTVSLVSDGFYEQIADGRLLFRQDEIAALEPGRATLRSGAKIPADIVICGTGWDQRADFLPADIKVKATDKDGNFRLYRSMIPVGVPRLAFNGYNSSFFSQLNAEVGSFWIAEWMAGRIALPSEQSQNELITERLSWMAARTGGNHCKGTNIVPFSLHQIDEVLGDIGLRLPFWRRLLQWVRPVNGSDFRRLSVRRATLN